MNRSKKRFLAVASVSLAAIATLAGCGTNNGNQSKGNSSSKQENITFAWWTNPSRTKMTKQAVKLFEKKYPNIHVTMEYSPWNGYWTKMATEAAGGSQPDVMQMDASYINQYVSKNQLMDLSNTSIDTSGLSQNTVKLGEVNGKLYAVPVAINAICYIYNPAILKKAGITYDPTKSYTWDQFANILIEVHKKLPNVYGATDDIWQEAPLAYWARTHGESMYSADDKSIGMTQQTLAAWFQYWLNLQNQGGVQPAQENSSWDHTNQQESPFDKGQAAFTYMFIGEGPQYQQALGGPIQRILYPEWNLPSKPYMLHPAMYWSISSTTKYPAAAEKLVNFLENDPQVSKIFQNDRGVTANVKNMQADAQALGGTVKVQDEFMNKVQKVSSTVPLDPPNAGQLTNLLQTIGQEVTFNKLTPSQAAAQFIQQANQILSQGNS
ncbi:ABC transporter substrate-binding protein [Alicyclobacillus fodiniaquatilis]|uniref:ABC transporter substrate-binding protein n=1 Tax=Alicyclobacillus fodiniaquatilis TaxID=1661150 RepID=A0ABW4JF50_9BACL